MDNCPIPDSLNPHQIHQRIRSTLEKECHLGKMSISAYSDKSESVDELFMDYFRAGITLNNTVRGETVKFDQMAVDILVYGIDNRAHSNIILISKEISEHTVFGVLRDLKSANFFINVVQPEQVKSKLLRDIASKEWIWPSESEEDIDPRSGAWF